MQYESYKIDGKDRMIPCGALKGCKQLNVDNFDDALSFYLPVCPSFSNLNVSLVKRKTIANREIERDEKNVLPLCRGRLFPPDGCLSL